MKETLLHYRDYDATVRMNAALHGRMVRWAHARGVSLNAAVLLAAEEFLARHEETV